MEYLTWPRSGYPNLICFVMPWPIMHSLQHWQVTDYLKKKGFTKTEAIFRQETSNLGPDGRPIHRDDEAGPKKYTKAFNLLREYVENSLDLYKVCERFYSRRRGCHLLTCPSLN